MLSNIGVFNYKLIGGGGNIGVSNYEIFGLEILEYLIIKLLVGGNIGWFDYKFMGGEESSGTHWVFEQGCLRDPRTIWG